MPLMQRIESLKKRHTDLDQHIRAESSRPMPDGLRLHKLKIEKLAIKENIDRLMGGGTAAA